jgi:uncharacterized protein YegL
MGEKFNFLFVVDVSGSMYGQKIASVNAALTECLAAIKQIGFSGQYDINVSIATFAEKLHLQKVNQKPESIEALNIKVEPLEDGFYLVTSFASLYRGLKYLFTKKTITDEQQGKNTFIFLFSDAKPVDGKEYGDAFEEIQNCLEFKNANKYVGFVDEDSDKYNKDTIMFVDYKAEHIVRASEISNEISKLQMMYFSDFSSQSDKDKYDQIFV